MQALYGQFDLDSGLQRGIEVFTRFPLLVQQLTVLSLRLPGVYQQTLVVTWLCLVLGTKMQMVRAERADLVVGALSHMIGMLHIRPEVAMRTDSFSPEEQKEIQKYVERGKVALQNVPNFPPGILAMVAEHRELPDGTGYPLRLEGSVLGLPGQMIGVAQSAYAIYMKTLRPRGRGVRDLIPIIQINSAVYRRDICSALLQLIRERRLPAESMINDTNIEEVVQRLLEDAEEIESCRRVVSEIIRRLQECVPDAAVVRAERIYRHLESILNSSGILDSGHAAWMKQVAQTRYDKFYREIEDLDLMLGEVRWQIRRLSQILREFPTEITNRAGVDVSELNEAMKNIHRRR
jgi:hypothetical protein